MSTKPEQFVLPTKEELERWIARNYANTRNAETEGVRPPLPSRPSRGDDSGADVPSDRKAA